MHHRGGDRARTRREQEVGGVEDRPAGSDLVVDEQAVLALDLADHRAHLRVVVVAGAPLVDDRQRQIELLGEAPRVLGLSHVGSHHHRILDAALLELLAQHRHRGELIGRHGEEALDLRRVQIDGHHPIGARRLHQIGHQPRADRDARLVLLVAARVEEVRNDRGHAPRRGVLERIEQDQQLDDVLRQRRRRGLHHEHVVLAHVLLDLHLQVLVREAHRGELAERDLQAIADLASDARSRRTPSARLSWCPSSAASPRGIIRG